MRIKGVTILVLRTTDFPWPSSGVNLEDCIFGPIDIGIHSHAEEMLVVVGVDPWVDFSSPTESILSRVHCIRVEYPGELDLELYSTILVEDPVNTVLVVRCCEDVRDKKLPSASHNDGVVTEISVLEQNASVFFVDAYGVLNGLAGTSAVDKVGRL